MDTAFDILQAACDLEASGIPTNQAEAIVQAIRSSGEAAVTRSGLDAATSALAGEIATAGLLFAAIKLFG